jgi:hypothetical protein
LLDNDLYRYYVDEGYDTIANLTQLNSDPWFVSEYTEEFSDLMFKDMCENFLYEYTKKDSSCDDELLNTGLETMSIFIMENTRKLLNQFDLNGADQAAAQNLLNSNDFKNLGKLQPTTKQTAA